VAASLDMLVRRAEKIASNASAKIFWPLVMRTVKGQFIGLIEPKGTKYAGATAPLPSQELETGTAPYSRRKGQSYALIGAARLSNAGGEG